MNKPIYEIPLTDPGAPPFGAPGTAGAMPPMRGQLPPDALPATDLSQLPPPTMAPAMAPAMAPQYATPAAAPQYSQQPVAPSAPGTIYAPPPMASTADFTTAPPVGVASSPDSSYPPPGYTPAPQLAPIFPGSDLSRPARDVRRRPRRRVRSGGARDGRRRAARCAAGCAAGRSFGPACHGRLTAHAPDRRCSPARRRAIHLGSRSSRAGTRLDSDARATGDLRRRPRARLRVHPVGDLTVSRQRLSPARRDRRRVPTHSDRDQIAGEPGVPEDSGLRATGPWTRARHRPYRLGQVDHPRRPHRPGQRTRPTTSSRSRTRSSSCTATRSRSSTNARWGTTPTASRTRSSTCCGKTPMSSSSASSATSRRSPSPDSGRDRTPCLRDPAHAGCRPDDRPCHRRIPATSTGSGAHAVGGHAAGGRLPDARPPCIGRDAQSPPKC